MDDGTLASLQIAPTSLMWCDRRSSSPYAAQQHRARRRRPAERGLDGAG